MASHILRSPSEALNLVQQHEVQVNFAGLHPGMLVQIAANFDEPEDIAFEIGTVISVEEDFVRVQLNNDPTSIIEASSEDVFQLDEDAEIGIPDLANLQQMHEAALLSNITSRYNNRQMFTRVGPTLVAVNPYEFVQSVIENIEEYMHGEPGQGEPHVYEIAQKAWLTLWESERPQGIVISGESGSGKTEACKQIIGYLTAVGAANANIEEFVLSCNPVLEAFGNAKTVLNDNSTRFVKYMKLFVDGITRDITGGMVETALLQKGRVTNRNHDERNFHVFYMFCQYAPSRVLYNLNIQQDPQQYNYLRGSTFVYGLDDRAAFEELLQAFETLGFHQQEQEAIWKVLAIILHLGNIEFDDGKYMQDASQPCRTKGEAIDHVCQLLQIQRAPLEKILTHSARRISGNQVYTPAPRNVCEFYRDSLSRTLYERLFNWIVGKINETLHRNKSSPLSITITDLFGFESLSHNGFEQYCVNYANEKMLQLYITTMFKEEEEEYFNEGLHEHGLQLDFVDNQQIIELLDQHPTGIFQLTDEACQVKKDDIGLLHQISTHHRNNELLTLPALEREKFIIAHSSRDTDYTITGFTVSNQDEINKELCDLISSSPDPLLSGISNIAVDHSKSLGSRFRKEINDICLKLRQSELHYIRCIKPNEFKQPWALSQRLVLGQIQALGILDAIAVRRQGYAVRFTFERFYRRYEDLAEEPYLVLKSKRVSWKDCAVRLLNFTLPGLGTDYVLLGKNKIFLRAEVHSTLENLRFDAKQAKRIAASVISGWWLGKNQQMKYSKLKRAVRQLKDLWATREERRRFNVKKIAKRVLHRYFRGKLTKIMAARGALSQKILHFYFKRRLAQLFTSKTHAAAIDGQRLVRGFLARKKAKRMRFVRMILYRMVETALEKAEHRSRVRAATTIQKYIRGYRFRTRNSTIMRDINIRVHNSIRNVYARKIQRVYRGKLVRDKLQSMTAAAMVIQGYFRAKWMQESFHDLRNDVIMIQRAFRAYLTWKRIVKERLERFLGQEYALMHNLRLLENSELFSTVSPTNIPPHIQQAYKTLSSIAATNAASNQAQLAQMGSISKQTLPANPFHIERMYFFTRVLDLDLLTDVSLIYEPLWSQQFEQLTNDCLEHEELMMELGVGGAHSGAITARGRVFMWGWNDKGQCLGNGRKPRLVEQFKDKRIVQLSCGDDHSLSLDSSGSVWAFGENTKGQLGQGHYREVKEPVQVQVPPTRQVAATGGQCFAVTRSNELYMWPFETKHREKRSHPIRVMSELLVSEVAVGYNFALILVTSGQVYSYGINNSEGQLGHGDTEPRTAPALIESLKKEKVAGVSCGFRHSIARSTLGRVFTWGWGGRGQLGHNNYHSQHSPQILLVKGQRVKAIQASAGHKHSVLMLENRKIVWFGTNSEIADVCVPIEANLAVKLPEFFTKNSDFNVVKVQCVWSRSLSLTMITIADLRYLKVPKIKLANSLGLLCTKWTSNTIEPPSVEALAQFYPTVAIKRGSPLKQRRDDLKERTRSILSRPEDRWTPEERSIIEKTQRK